MHVLRLARPDDADGLLRLAQGAGAGITTLPRTAEEVARRLERSAEGAAYLMVLEDLEASDPEERVVGVSGVVPELTADDPFYTYRVARQTKHSDTLGVTIDLTALHFVSDFSGPAELVTLFLSAAARGSGLGRLLSLGRFLFMHARPGHFAPVTVVELRGIVDEDGQSPFWKTVCHHPFQVDYATADRLSASDRRFIADLFPEHPIYVHLLPQAVQDAIGRVHPLTEPALNMLQAEGFVENGYVDIFDGGPMLRCPTADIRTIRQARTLRVEMMRGITDDAPRVLMASGFQAGSKSGGSGDPFRCTADRALLDGETIRLAPEVAEALGVEVGDEILCSPERGD